MPKLPVVEVDLNEMANLMAEELGYSVEDDPGYTAPEIAKSLGIAVTTARKWIRRLDEKGKIIKGKARRLRKDGRPLPVTVYLFNPDGKKGGEKE